MSDSSEMNKVHEVGVCDAHCHPTDIMDSVARIASMKAKVLTVMSTRSQDQKLVADAATQYLISHKDQLDQHDDQRYVVPAFGWHPWFSHQMRFDIGDNESTGKDDTFDATKHYQSVLTPIPDDREFLDALMPPLSLSEYLKETEDRLKQFPLGLVGEIGIDRPFRLTEGPTSITGDVSQKTGGDEGTYTPGSREGRPLTPYRVQMEHQKKILKAQLGLAAKHRRPVSVHSVQAHGVVHEVFQELWKGHMRPSKREAKKKREAVQNTVNENAQEPDASVDSSVPYPPRICMHSYSGPKETLKLFLDPKVPSDVFFSFSECINFGSSSKKAVDVIKAVPEDRILVESDLHCAGEMMDGLLQDIVKRVCEIKGWQLVEGARILRKNWERFIFGE